jgi:hypothetical protein
MNSDFPPRLKVNSLRLLYEQPLRDAICYNTAARFGGKFPPKSCLGNPRNAMAPLRETKIIPLFSNAKNSIPNGTNPLFLK